MRDRDRGWRREVAAIAVVTALAVAVVLAVDPRGDFPLNDDWCYAKAVRHLLAVGEVHLEDWGSMALLTQLLWGAGFARVFGFSFETLRASTLVLGLAGLLFLYGIARELGAARRVAVLAAAALLAAPLFVLLAHTFMTDVPFLAFSLGALWLFLRGFRRGSNVELGAGFLMALAATFTRQVGLALFVGFGAATLVSDWRRAGRWVLAVAPALLGFLLLRTYESWLARTGALPTAYNLQWRTIAERFATNPLDLAVRWLGNVVGIGVEVGLFTLPLAILWLLRAEPGLRRRCAVVVAMATTLAAALAVSGRLVPMFPNNVLAVGCVDARIAVGPISLQGACAAPHPGLGALGVGARSVLTWLGALAVAALIVALYETIAAAKRDERVGLALLLATAVSYVVVIALIDVFQRYLLFLVPIALATLVAALRGRPVRAPALAIGAMLALVPLLWTVGAVAEYLDWNRARWRAIAYLASDLGAKREEIDGGFEFGGWLNFDARFRHDRRGASWWWVVDDRYVVAFDVIDGYTPLRSFAYKGWFGLVEGEVLALERTSERDRRAD